MTVKTTQTASGTRSQLGRSRWAAVGAAVAVSLGAGGMLQANAAGSADSEPALFIATTPCRLIDTRPAPATVGPRAEPLAANSTYSTRVLGANGRCTIPDDATTLVMNVTAGNATASSFLTVYPTGSARPDTSSLNWVAGSSPVANAVTANVSASGELSFFNEAGSVNLIADVVGYYTSAPLDDYYTKAQVDALIAQNPGPVGPQGAPGPDGAKGPQGAPGNNGADGAPGLDGKNGLAGASGNDGAPGAVGPAGPQGAPGLDGKDGLDGAVGAQGAVGPKGDTGEVGPAAPVGYGYFYNESSQIVPIEADVAFDSNGLSSSILHVPESTQFVFLETGTFAIAFSISGVEPNQFALFVNGAPIPGGVFGSGNGTQQTTGKVIIAVSAGDVLTLRNHTSAAAVTLQTLAGGTQLNVNASITIQRLSVDVPI